MTPVTDARPKRRQRQHCPHSTLRTTRNSRHTRAGMLSSSRSLGSLLWRGARRAGLTSSRHALPASLYEGPQFTGDEATGRSASPSVAPPSPFQRLGLNNPPCARGVFTGTTYLYTSSSHATLAAAAAEAAPSLALRPSPAISAAQSFDHATRPIPRRNDTLGKILHTQLEAGGGRHSEPEY